MPEEPKAKTVAEIADDLRERIKQYEIGSRLAPAVALSKEYGTSRDTINRAIRLLQSEGLLESRGEETRGVVVSQPRMYLSGLTPRFDLELQRLGLIPYEANIDEPAIVTAPVDVARALGAQEGTSVVRRFRLQGEKKVGRETKTGRKEEDRIIPYRIAENFYPTTLVDESILEQMQEDERFDALLAIKGKTGKVPMRVHEDLNVRLPRERERDLLQITPQTSVVEILRISYAEDDTIIMVNKIILVASAFTLSYDYPVNHWRT